MLDTSLMEHLQSAAYPTPQDVIQLFIGGSELHGAKVGTTDDIDLYGVFIEQPEEVIGLNARPHFIWSTAGDDRRNGPDDIDITLYSLRRWAHLAAKGNATALHFLFADATAVSDAAWSTIQASSDLFLAKQSAEQFLGFAENQRKRITGEAGRGTRGRRPEYECIHGYDSKAAMHCLRLYYECIELMGAGRITLPRRNATSSSRFARAITRENNSTAWQRTCTNVRKPQPSLPHSPRRSIHTKSPDSSQAFISNTGVRPQRAHREYRKLPPS